MQCSSQSGARDNIDLKDTCFTPDLEEYPIETPSNEPIVAPDNNNNMLMSSQFLLHIQESTNIEGASVSEVIEHPYPEGVQST